MRLVGVLDASMNRRLLAPPPDIETLLIATVPVEVILTRLVSITPPPTLTEGGAESTKLIWDKVFDEAMAILDSVLA